MDIHTQENNLQSQCETESSIDIIFHEVIRKITGAKATEGKERLVQILQALKDNFILELKDVIDMAQKIKEDDINSMLNKNLRKKHRFRNNQSNKGHSISNNEEN